LYARTGKHLVTRDDSATGTGKRKKLSGDHKAAHDHRDQDLTHERVELAIR